MIAGRMNGDNMALQERRLRGRKGQTFKIKMKISLLGAKGSR